MPRPFKFRYVHELTGIFVFASVLIFAAMIVFAARIQGWFEPRVEYRTVFSTREGTFGLQKGAEVQILNTAAGNVVSILPTETGDIEARFRIKRAFQKFVREDSRALVKKKFGVAGDAYLEIRAGSPGSPMVKADGMIECHKDTEVMETVQDLMEDLQKEFVPAVEQLQAVLGELPELTRQVHTTFKEAEIFLREFREKGIPAVESVRVFFSEDLPKVADKLDSLAENLDTWIQEFGPASTPAVNGLRETLKTVNALAGELRDYVAALEEKKLGRFVNDLPELGYKIENTLNEAQIVLKGAQKHWLLRKYVGREDDAAETVLSPFEIEFPHEHQTAS